mgnify:CR=1 FL=1
MALLITTAACDSNGDNEPGASSDSKASQNTVKAIKTVFPGLRIDSIASYKEYGNIKITYDGDLLTSYKECYSDGKVHDGVYFTLEWDKDTITIRNYAKTYKAAIGPNGCVNKLICPNGKVNRYEYDSDMRLLKYDRELVDINDNEQWELTWQEGNMVKGLRTYKNGANEHLYEYSGQDNKAGILNPYDRQWWIDDSGLSEGNGINAVLYFAGVLGKGTATLPIPSSDRYVNETYIRKYSYTYQVDTDGYVVSADFSNSYDSGVIKYFYTSKKL